jgi:CRISPR-associated protein Csd2
MSLSKKIDFAVVFRVNNANPNGDPLNGNRPRVTYEGLGEVSDVCLKRKIRNRLLEGEHGIFVQSDDSRSDEHPSLRSRYEAVMDKTASDRAKIIARACSEWFDVRAFGQLFPFPSKGKKGKGDESGSDAVSIGIRGPVTVQSAYSLAPVSVSSTQITKSVNLEGDGTKRGADTMGMKHRVDSGVYVFFGSMSPQLAEKTGFSDEDAGVIKAILPRMFENDESAARPSGSMEVLHVVWWEHPSKSGQCSSAKIHGSLRVNPAAPPDEMISFGPGDGPEPEIFPGF